jgi:hypothetical protein
MPLYIPDAHFGAGTVEAEAAGLGASDIFPLVAFFGNTCPFRPFAAAAVAKDFSGDEHFLIPVVQKFASPRTFIFLAGRCGLGLPHWLPR